MNAPLSCIECKKSARCFNTLIPAELEFINQKKIQISYQKGETICKQNSFATSVVYIVDGLAKLYLENTNNKFTNIALLSSASFIGISSIFGSKTYAYSLVALKETHVCMIDKKGIRKLMKRNATFATELIKQYCLREKELFNVIKSISYKQMPGRLADALIKLSKKENAETSLFPYLSRRDIAEFACISKESTIKLLNEFKNEGIITIHQKEIEILKPDKLLEISKLG